MVSAVGALIKTWAFSCEIKTKFLRLFSHSGGVLSRPPRSWRNVSVRIISMTKNNQRTEQVVDTLLTKWEFCCDVSCS